jgi:hypothetical protein
MKHLVYGVAFVAVLAGAPPIWAQTQTNQSSANARQSICQRHRNRRLHRRRGPPPSRLQRPRMPRQFREPSGLSLRCVRLRGGTRALTHTTATTAPGARPATTLLMS